MFSLAYVLLPFSDEPPADAIARSLERYRRGGRGDVPDEWLTFHDETAAVRSMHEASFTFTRDRGLRIEGADTWYLDGQAVLAEMARRGKDRWSVRFADLHDLDAFAGRYVRHLERHLVTGGFGQWQNPLGRWDWWELGGRFDGRIRGEAACPGRANASVSSGPSRGRDVLAGLESALSDALGQDAPPNVDVRTDDNVELVVRLRSDLEAGRKHALPGALVLPPGTMDDSLRWIGTWPELRPRETLAALALRDDASWAEVAGAAYARWADHWAAAIAFHH